MASKKPMTRYADEACHKQFHAALLSTNGQTFHFPTRDGRIVDNILNYIVLGNDAERDC
jgi:hypothetical protein